MSSASVSEFKKMSNRNGSQTHILGNDINNHDDASTRSFSNVTGENTTEGGSPVFDVDPRKLQDLVDPKNKDLLDSMGGLEGIVKSLHVNPDIGLSPYESFGPTSTTGQSARKKKNWFLALFKGSQKELYDETVFIERTNHFGHNVLPKVRERTIFEYMWIAMHDKILIMLTVAAFVSLGIGLYEEFGHEKDPNAKKKGPQWIEGLAIIIAILIVVLVQSVNDFQKERQFRKLNAKKELRKVKVLREGQIVQVSIYDLQVGDVCLLEPGDMVNVDGIICQAHNLKCDESSATGESDLIQKQAYSKDAKDPFVLSGSKVAEGVGRFVVTAVGENSFYGKTMLGLRVENEDTPLQVKLDHLADNIAGLGLGAALLLFLTLTTKFIVQQSIKGWDQMSGAEIGSMFVEIIIETIIIVVVAVPEGLPLAVTLALAYATTRMTKDNNLVRVLASCETMGGATTICSDKTGTLTQNKMTVVAGLIGLTVEFRERSGLEQLKRKFEIAELRVMDQTNNPGRQQGKFKSGEYLYLLCDGIAINSTAFEEKNEHTGEMEFVGNKTETALLEFGRQLGLKQFQQIRNESLLFQVYPFSSARKSMSVCVKRMTSSGEVVYRVYTKGASEMVLKQCEKVLKIAENNEFTKVELTDELRRDLQLVIGKFADESLRTLCLAYHDYSEQELKQLLDAPDLNVHLTDAQSELLEKDFQKHLTLLTIVGIEDPLREGVAEAVEQCQKAGVFVRMVTGDNLRTAKAIATKCGIYMRGGLVLEGHRFRKMSEEEMERIIPRLQVLARSSPQDKQILVQKLKKMGETVAVTGDGTNDGPALKMADVGFSMGIAGTEVAKEASSIILMDDNFSSIVKAMMWGRCVNDSVKKFLQFQLTVNVSAVLLAFITSVASDDNTSILTAVQLLWVNLIMDSLAALALATDPPTLELLDRYPESKQSPLITVPMLKMIFGQAIFQVTVGLILFWNGEKLIPAGYLQQNNVTAKQINGTFVFNTFVFMQLFNELNCRRIDSKFNVFAGILKNYFFISISIGVLIFQIIIVQFGQDVFSCYGLPASLWGFSVLFSALTLPLGVAIRLIPNWDGCIVMGKSIAVPDNSRVYMNKERLQWQHSIGQVRTQISVFKALRGTNRPGSSSGFSSIDNSRDEIISFGSGSIRSRRKNPNNHSNDDLVVDAFDIDEHEPSSSEAELKKELLK